jgi:hypothetical protein
MSKKTVRQGKVRKIDATGIFESEGKSVEEAIKEIDLDKLLEEELRKGVSFDTHFVTAKCVEFGKILTGMPLYSYQEEMAYAIIHHVISFENEVITMLLSRQSGKSETLAFVINTLSTILPALAKIIPDLEQFKNGIRIGLFAPQSDQVWNTYNRALLRISSENASMVMEDPDLDISLTSPKRYELTNGSSLTGQVASKQSKIESATYDLIICEEAQDIDDYIIQKSIEPMVSATGGTIIKCGTTGTQKNNFWYEIQHNKNKNRYCKDPRILYHYEYDYKKIFKARREQFLKDRNPFHLKYEKDVTKKMERWGRDSKAFRLSYALEWDLESGMLITDKEFEKLCNNKKGLRIEEDDIIIAGLDIGKEDASTVLTFGKVVWNPNDEEEPPKIEICGWTEIRNVDYEVQHQLIVEELYNKNVVNLCADYTGVGKAVVDRLMYAVGDTVNITPFTFSKQSKSEMWFNLIDFIQQKRLIIPANRNTRRTEEFLRFEEQMKNCLKYYDGPYIVCHKSDGFLDDYVDSLGMMLLATNFEAQEEIEEEIYNPMFEEQLINRKLRNDESW